MYDTYFSIPNKIFNYSFILFFENFICLFEILYVKLLSKKDGVLYSV